MAIVTKKTRAAVASSPDVEAVAEELLKRGNAIDAVVAGVFAACAASPSVLLGPVQILMGGAGAGLHAIDGRVRQPGIGAPRPRGFQQGEAVPDAARVGVPWLPAALASAMAAAGTATFAQVTAPAVALAKGTPREAVLARFAQRGARALEERPLGAELLALAGRPSGGLLTADDLASARPEVSPATKIEIERAKTSTGALGRVVVTLPWAHVEGRAPVPPSSPVDAGWARAVVAVDRHGSFAAACWDESPEGLTIGELGLRAPFFAEPVMRGATRIRPGEPRPAAAPVAFVGTSAGPEVAFAAFGAGDAYDVLRGAVEGLLDEERIEAHGEARLVAVTHAQGAASVFR
jgi:gamma-glutamyltranspeptidase/glutathione hydrolase